MQNEKMQIIGGIFLMFSQGKITKEEILITKGALTELGEKHNYIVNPLNIDGHWVDGYKLEY